MLHSQRLLFIIRVQHIEQLRGRKLTPKVHRRKDRISDPISPSLPTTFSINTNQVEALSPRLSKGSMVHHNGLTPIPTRLNQINEIVSNNVELCERFIKCCNQM